MLLRHVPMLAAATTIALAAAAKAETVTKIETVSDWSLYADGASPHKFCFVSSEPKSSDPADTAREAPRAYISAWPKDGVTAEISIKQGYKIKPGSKVAVSVGAETFKLFPQDERAFLADAAQEAKLITAMKKGATLTVQGSPERGDITSDTYSLNGISQALQAMAEKCG